MNTIYKSTNQQIQIEIIGYDEPNNGRALHVVNLYINGELQNEKYFGNWNRLNENLSEYNMNALNGDFVFIPAEGKSFLIDSINLNKIELPYKALSTLTFKGNKFTESELIINYTDETLNFNLIDYTFINDNKL